MVQSHMPATGPHTKVANNTISSNSLDSSDQEQILTAPELRSMAHTESEYSYMHRNAHYVAGFPHSHSTHGQAQYNPYNYRHSFQGPSRYDTFASQIANQILDSSVDNVIELSASSRGVPPAMARRTRSLDMYSNVPPMFQVMDASIHHGNIYGESTSLPGSPSSAASASPVQTSEGAFLLGLMADGNPHPLYVPTMTVSDSSEKQFSCSPSPSLTCGLSNPFQSSFSSPLSSNSTCHSPSLSVSSLDFNRKRYSTDSSASQDTLYNVGENAKSLSTLAKRTKQRYICHFPNCSRTFSRPYNLKSHGLTHDTHRPHACGKCAKTFARVHDRDRHMNSHMPQKPHECIVCMGRFARQDAVIRHLKLSNETNACAWILKSNGISFRDAAAGRVTREALGEESEIRQTLETLEEHARRTRASRTLEMMGGSLIADRDQ
ncbi:hypothetical protein BGZ58_002654 [Dissophora ornata]|nr:hypothetical protein BGZ58_002654 [Dissophora ornata]